MRFVVYTLYNAIDSFFATAGLSSSKTECDGIAFEKCGGPIRPVSIQGLTSYTVIAGPNGNKIVQFRGQTALLDMDMLALAKETYGDVVPSCSEVGLVGDPSGSQLVMYEMDRLPGENYAIARLSLSCDKRLNTVHSLATVFAQSWQRGLLVDLRWVDMSTISTECYARFEYLVDALPERFLPAVAEVQAGLPSLLDGRYPVVLTHADLNETNILIDPNSGEITGLVDWSSASIQPFGFALYALEDVLGIMRVSGWEWHDNVDYLRDAFWRAFGEQTGLPETQIRLIKLAGKAGILIRYGTAYDSGFSGLIGVRDQDSEDFRRLDALLFREPFPARGVCKEQGQIET